MNATDVAGKGEWHDSTITLTDLHRFRPVTIRYDDGRKAAINSRQAVVWGRDAQHPHSAARHWTPGKRCSLAVVLPPSTLKFSVDGRDPTYFLFKGDLHAGEIGPVR
ncbi:hypothetical protein DMI70_17260 [Escherichia coli]|nr:hypothetical protein [Escherichia coli]